MEQNRACNIIYAYATSGDTLLATLDASEKLIST